MAPEPHPKTLFHLVPTNQVAQDALLHPDNRRYVSSSKKDLGLEVGYHVPTMARGNVITRLGRSGDLILRESRPGQPMSGVHVAFEINPSTHLVLLSVRSKYISSVTFAVLDKPNGKEKAGENVARQVITGDGVILYQHDYEISIASYKFRLIWRAISDEANDEALKSLAIQGYEASRNLVREMHSRDRPTEVDYSEAQSWHMTRLRTAKEPHFQDIPSERKKIGEGAYGQVYRTIDLKTGYTFAVKVVNLSGQDDVDAARATLHREIKVMQMLSHNHIVEYLGHQLFHTSDPEVFMPLREGSMTTLMKQLPPNADRQNLCSSALGQMLSAVDYLASQNFIHRDVKPDNILYYFMNGVHHFQLADFGLANHRDFAKTRCGTGFYQAPEFWPHESGVIAAQTSKLDIWSLFATMVAVWLRPIDFPPRQRIDDYGIILNILRAKVPEVEGLEPMARTDPDHRASAAQMLVYLYQGEGLTTPRSKIPPIQFPGPDIVMTDASSHQNTGKGPERPPAADSRLLITTPRAPKSPARPLLRTAGVQRDNGGRPFTSRLPPIAWRADGVGKRRGGRRTPRANAYTRDGSKAQLSPPRG